MTDQPVKLKALRDELLRASGKYHKDATCVEFANALAGLLDEVIADFSRTDAARVEAERQRNEYRIRAAAAEDALGREGEQEERIGRMIDERDALRTRIASLESDLARAREDSARGKQVEEAARIAYGQLCKVHPSSIEQFERDFVTAAYGALESVFAFGKLPAFISAYTSLGSATHSEGKV